MFNIIKALLAAIARDVRVQAALGTLVTASFMAAAAWATTAEGASALGALAGFFGLLTPLVEALTRPPQLPSIAVFHRPGDAPPERKEP